MPLGSWAMITFTQIVVGSSDIGWCPRHEGMLRSGIRNVAGVSMTLTTIREERNPPSLLNQSFTSFTLGAETISPTTSKNERKRADTTWTAGEADTRGVLHPLLLYAYQI